MQACMYLFINKGLGMSTGKVASQAAHAAVEAYRLSIPDDLMDAWFEGKHYTKLVMECRDREHLLDTERYLNDRGFETALIIDEGHTEIDPIIPTALGVVLVDRDDPHVQATFESFDSYHGKPEPRLGDQLDPYELQIYCDTSYSLGELRTRLYGPSSETSPYGEMAHAEVLKTLP